jgi:hypothetical protein
MVQVAPPRGWTPPAKDEQVAPAVAAAAVAPVVTTPTPVPSVVPSVEPASVVNSAAPAHSFAETIATAATESTTLPVIGATKAAWYASPWLAWSAVPVAALASALAVWAFSGASAPLETAPPQLTVAVTPPPAEIAPAAPPTQPIAPAIAPTKRGPEVKLDRRWIPTEARGVVSLRLRHLHEQPMVQQMLVQGGVARWAEIVGPLYNTFQLSPKPGQPRSIDRISWSVTDLAGMGLGSPDQVVVVLDFVEPVPEADSWLAQFEKLTDHLGDAPLYRAKAGGWSQPFALLDGRTVVTGPLSLLLPLAAKPADAKLDNRELDLLVEQLDAANSAVMAIDWSALRSSLRLGNLFLSDSWGVDRRDWQLVRDLPLAAGVQLKLADTLYTELTLVCDSESAAERVHNAIDPLTLDLETAVSRKADALAKEMATSNAGSLTVDQAHLLLHHLQEALRVRDASVDRRTVSAHARWSGDLPALGVTALAMLPSRDAGNVAAPPAKEQAPAIVDKPPQPMPIVEAPRPAAPPVVASQPKVPPVAGPIAQRPRNNSNNASRADIEAKLKTKLPSINIPDAPLAKFVEFLSSLSGLSITFDLEGMREAGAQPDDKFTIRRADTTVRDLLEAVLLERGLGFLIQDGQVVITNLGRQNAAFESARYEVGDLAGADVPRVVSLVTQFVEPSSWSTAGGQATIAAEGSVLVVVQNEAGHRQVASLLERLRLARSKTPLKANDARRTLLETRFARIAGKMSAPITVNVREPKPLARVIDDVQSIAGLQMRIDGPALTAADRSGQSEAPLMAANKPLSEVLDAIVQPLGLAWRIVDDRTLEITSPEAVRGRGEFELYRVADLVAQDPTAGHLMERIRSCTPAESWKVAGGTGAMLYDAASSSLLVWQTQPVQQQVERTLGEARRTP